MESSAFGARTAPSEDEDSSDEESEDEESEEETAEGEANQRRVKERTYTLGDVQRALRIMFARPKLTGKKVSPADAAREAGHPQMAWKVRQVARRLRQLPDDDNAAQIAHIEGLSEEDVFPAKGPKARGASVPTVLTDVEDLHSQLFHGPAPRSPLCHPSAASLRLARPRLLPVSV